jgi:hypothetical protein
MSFPVSLLRSSLKNLKIITEGTNLICQLVLLSDNPIFLYNNELFRRNDHNNVFQMLKKLNNFSNFDDNWNGLNMLNSSLSENRRHFLSKFQEIKENFSNLVFIAYFLVTPSGSAVNNVMMTKPVKQTAFILINQ